MYKNKHTSIYIRLVALTLVVTMLLGLPVANRKLRAEVVANATVINVSSYANVRDRASTEGDVVTTASLGVRIAILESDVEGDEDDTSSTREWCKISYRKFNTTFEGYILSRYVLPDETVNNDDVSDPEFEASIASFPDSYKPYLRTLHEEYPDWVFHAEHVGETWESCLEKETRQGVSLVQDSTDATWQSSSYTEIADSPNWVNASRSLVAYFMDPRNMLNESAIFQFVDLNYTDNSIDPEVIDKVLEGTFMGQPAVACYNTDQELPYMNIFAIAGNNAGEGTDGINPIFLASHAIQECGTRGSVSSRGDSGFYNFYNIGAYSDAINAAAHGLALAENGLDEEFNSTYEIPWNTPGLSIVNGGKWIYNNYTKAGQDTLYYIRFNVSPDRTHDVCTHQYMTATQSVSHEGQRMFDAYRAADMLQSELHFYIPVYEQMPEIACEVPTVMNVYNEFVDSLYVNLLGRNAGANEKNYFTAQLASGVSAASVAYGFIASSEFQGRNLSLDDYIKLLYTTFVNREPTNRELNNVKDFYNMGYTRDHLFAVVINSDAAKSYLSYFNIALTDFTSPDYIDRNMSISPLVEQLYQGVLGRSPDRDGMRNWVKTLADGTMSGPQVAAAFCRSEEMDALDLSNEEFVERLYLVCFGREPDDYGFNDWLDKLNNCYTREFVVAGFVNSNEFIEQCEEYGIGVDEFEPSTIRGLSPNSARISAFVTRLYDLALEREPDREGLASWANGLKDGSLDGYSVSYGFIFSEEMDVIDPSNEELITRLYRIFLNREPDEDGFNDWMERMDDGYSKLELFEGFVYSEEFKILCIQAGFKPYESYEV